MAVSTIRRATSEDIALWKTVEERFYEDHIKGDLSEFDMATEINFACEENPRLNKIWEQRICRAFGFKRYSTKHQLVITGGYIGTSGW